MGDIVFDIFNDAGKVKIRVGSNLYTLNASEIENLRNFLIMQAKYPAQIAIPNTMRSMVIMFENGTIALNLAMGSIGTRGYILIVTYTSPEIVRYDTNMFFVDMTALQEYISSVTAAIKEG